MGKSYSDTEWIDLNELDYSYHRFKNLCRYTSRWEYSWEGDSGGPFYDSDTSHQNALGLYPLVLVVHDPMKTWRPSRECMECTICEWSNNPPTNCPSGRVGGNGGGGNGRNRC
jgi:hypothetical protein